MGALSVGVLLVMKSGADWWPYLIGASFVVMEYFCWSGNRKKARS